tara:strand:- start:53 stop:214 length:162 start_codon:yes stop_codon:yes gene_type:complete
MAILASNERAESALLNYWKNRALRAESNLRIRALTVFLCFALIAIGLTAMGAI